MRLADLCWYDLPELTAATDAWWLGIRGHLLAFGVEDVPVALQRGGSHHDRWQDGRLLLSQACGYDLLYDHAEHLVPIATPCFAIEGCLGPRYRSIVVVRRESAAQSLAGLRGARAVVNEASSHSGNNALRPLVAPLAVDGTFFASVEATGSHTDSIAAVRAGEADVACVDAVVLGLMRRARPTALAGLRPLVCTELALAPPYVTSVHTSPVVRLALGQALRAAVLDPALAAPRRVLGIQAFVELPASAYAELEEFEQPALAAAYFELPAPRRSPLHREPGMPRSAAGSKKRPCLGA